jgi:predicted O-methyltransferase YrrM
LLRQARSDRAQARRARRLSEGLSNDPRAKTALTEYADELERRADELERKAEQMRMKMPPAGT